MCRGAAPAAEGVGMYCRRLFLAVICAICAGAPDCPGDLIGTVVGQISESTYRDYLDNRLYTRTDDERLWGPQHDLARSYIYGAFTSFGLSTSLQPFSYNSNTYYNVVGVHAGSVTPERIYIVGAHYDSAVDRDGSGRGVPGADDNASGTAGVLELARVLSQCNFESTVVFIAFDREEQGLIGSKAYAAAHKTDDIRGMVSMDMIAYNPVTNHDKASIYGRASSLPLKQSLASAVTTWGGLAPVIQGQLDASDHAPFEAQGFQAALLIEYNAFSNPYYHRLSDTVDTPGYIDYAYATKMVRSVAAFLAEQAVVRVPSFNRSWQAASGEWNVADNWLPVGLPLSVSALTIDNGGTARVPSLSGTVECYSLTVGANTGGTLIVESYSELATGAVSGNGSIIVNGSLRVGADGASAAFSGTIGGTGELIKHGNGTWSLAGERVRTGRLAIEAGAVALVGSSQPVLEAGELDIAGGGSPAATLDLGDGLMILRAGHEARGEVLRRTTAWIAAARNAPGGLWQGSGVTSSVARAQPLLKGLAIALNEGADGAPLYGEFGGASVDGDCVLLRLTWNGDADLDGDVDAADYFRIDQGFINGATGWTGGDFDYSGMVDGADYYLIDLAFLAQHGGQKKAVAASAIPEPAGLLLLAGIAAMLGPAGRAMAAGGARRSSAR